jgi:uncharacterized membrane protein YraQ (UPF0718 family)
VSQKLIEIVNVFSCCIFTPKIVTTVLPAFLLAGAIAVFVPKTAVLHYLGPRACRRSAYLVSALSGVLLSLCSCNVVPLFVSIYRAGAGLGPAFTFLYAGPAINVVSLIFVFQVIGWRLGLWRAIGVPVIAVVVGLILAWIYRQEESVRAQDLLTAHTHPTANGGSPNFDRGELAPSLPILVLLLTLVVVGSLKLPWQRQGPALVGLLAIASLAAYRIRGLRGLQEWLSETWALIKLVVPVLVPAVLAIGVVATFIDVKWVYRLVGENNPQSIFAASVFGALMYFPILAEVAFTKAFLKLGMATGPALAILLTGSGLSLPGAIILGRVIGWGKVMLYLTLVVLLAALTAQLFALEIGQYLCPCTMGLK